MKHRQIGVSKVGVVNPDGHVIGLDIGATAVRAAVLAQGTLEGRPSVTVHGVGEVALPAGTVVNGEVREPELLTGAIKRLWSENSFHCRNVVLGIANQQVMVRDMTMPNLDPQRRAKALPYQAKEIIALPIDEVLLDFCQLGEPNKESDTVRGLLIAAPREPIVSAVTMVERAGLRVARVDLAAFGCLRAVGGEELTVEAVVDLGAHLTTIVIHDRGVPKLVRTVARGGDQLTAQLADSVGLTPQDAEQAKRAEGSDGDPDVARALVSGLRPIVAEITTSIGYFRATQEAQAIDRISLTGGTSQLRGIARAIQEQVGLPSRVVDPLQHVRNRLVSVEKKAEATGRPTAVSLGLAMGAAA